MLLPLICLAGPCLAPAEPALAPARAAIYIVTEDEAFEQLEEEFDDAAREWRALLRDARKAKDEAAQARLLETNPVKSFYPRFEALAQDGSARAALWTAARVEQVSDDPRVIVEEKSRRYSQAIAGLAATEEAKQLLRAIDQDGKALGAAVLERLLEEFAAKAKDPELLADALWRRARSVGGRAQDEQGREQVIALLEELESKYADTKAAKLAAGALYERRNLVVGATAPDFTTEDVDGVQFKLSDYRGKVVLLDFWGFW